jgi:serine phosphatase RsbU (regulator of sigma subunit)
LNALNELCVLIVDIDPDKSILFAKQQLEIAEQKSNQLHQALALNNIGNGYLNLADYKTCLTYYLKALKIQESLNNKKGILSCSGSIGNIFIELSRPDDAIKYFERGLQISYEIGNKNGVASCLISLGTIYSNKKEHKKGLGYFFQSLKLFQEVNNEDAIATNYNNIADTYQQLKDYPNALLYITKASDLYEKIGNVFGQSLALNNIGDFYHTLGKEEKALEYYKKGLEKGKLINANTHILQSYRGIAGAYKKLGDYKQALQIQELFQQTNDSIYNVEGSRQIEEMHARFDSEKKEQQIEVLNKDKQIQESNLKKQTILIWSVIAGLLLVIIFSVFMFNRWKITKRQKYIIEQQKKIVDLAYFKIEEKNKEITDSINYASRIQQAMLTSEEYITLHLKADFFILYQPKDIVSGDFYWAAQHNNSFYIAACDCTGHGVPGAFMSLLNISFLNENLIERNITEPDQILNEQRKKIIAALNPKGNENSKDGMDCVLCKYDFNTLTLTYAGANNPLWIIRNNQLIEFKPNKMPVGKFDEQEENFTQQIIQLQKDDLIYALTDGYADQFGGQKGKKFKYKQLKDLLLANCSLPLEQQKNIFEKTINDWKGNMEQVDDILLIGVKI